MGATLLCARVDDDTVVCRVDHRDGDIQCPILVDPYALEDQPSRVSVETTARSGRLRSDR
jgi:hypothetical protein